jgi:hypothetical protein
VARSPGGSLESVKCLEGKPICRVVRVLVQFVVARPLA